MTSKWIEELLFVTKLDEEEYISAAEVLSKIDKLLRRAMHETDDENFTDDIRKEISG